MPGKKKRKYIELKTSGGHTRVQWGKRGGDLRITVLIPRKHLEDRWADSCIWRRQCR
jgi:hypothetical protein